MLVQDPANKDRIERIPGRQTDRKTLLGELNWIFTSITDTIAWNMLPRSLFQKLFRQDLLLASLFRNFMLAERIMKACGCQPVSSPRLPPLHQHPLWDTWDVHAEAALMQLPAVMADESKFVASGFFREQLTAFELWLNHSGGLTHSPPQQLPIVLQVLLSQVHRVRALRLLGRFLDMGSACVELALSVGIFPYVLKLLQTTLPGLRRSLVFIWCKILATDTQCQSVRTLFCAAGCVSSSSCLGKLGTFRDYLCIPCMLVAHHSSLMDCVLKSVVA
jgi:regulatory associated protein of mTOR